METGPEKAATGVEGVFPRLETPASPDDGARQRTVAESGVGELDNLLGGGLEFGTACLLIGPTGTGKSSLATLYTHTAARGKRTAVFLFDERTETFHTRSQGMGLDLRPQLEAGTVRLQQVDAGENFLPASSPTPSGRP